MPALPTCDEWIFPSLSFGDNFSFSFHFFMKIKTANRKASDGMLGIAASHLGLFCLPMSHKKDFRLIWVKYNFEPIRREDSVKSYNNCLYT